MDEKNRSYSRRVRKGQVVTLLREVQGCTWAYDADGNNTWEVADRPVAPAGAKVTVISESNAGFRGIEFSFEYNGCRDFHHVSTGVIA